MQQRKYHSIDFLKILNWAVILQSLNVKDAIMKLLL